MNLKKTGFVTFATATIIRFRKHARRKPTNLKIIRHIATNCLYRIKRTL